MDLEETALSRPAHRDPFINKCLKLIWFGSKKPEVARVRNGGLKLHLRGVFGVKNVCNMKEEEMAAGLAEPLLTCILIKKFSTVWFEKFHLQFKEAIENSLGNHLRNDSRKVNRFVIALEKRMRPIRMEFPFWSRLLKWPIADPISGRRLGLLWVLARGFGKRRGKALWPNNCRDCFQQTTANSGTSRVIGAAISETS